MLSRGQETLSDKQLVGAGVGTLGVGVRGGTSSCEPLLCPTTVGGGDSCNRSGVGICSVTGHNLINAQNVYT